MAGETLWLRWLVATTVGELVGFSVPATVGAIVYALDANPAMLFGSLVAAGAGEGALLGLAQAQVLRRELAGFDRPAWVGATALAAAFAWCVGLLPSSLGERLEDVPLFVVIPVGLLLGVMLLLSIGVAQWRVLRRYRSRSALWIAANAVAWLAGLGVSVTLMSILLTEDTTAAAAIGIGTGAGLVMASPSQPSPAGRSYASSRDPSNRAADRPAANYAAGSAGARMATVGGRRTIGEPRHRRSTR